MTNAEESALAHWLTELTERGFPMRHSTLRDIANVIRQEESLKLTMFIT